MGLTEEFESAVSRSKQLPEKPANDVLLKIYSLYKQATEGDVSGDEPGMFDFVAKAKYQAWEECRGLTSDNAMQQYVDLITKLES
ncbi:MAG: acyl-CoA-binding protein [Acidobacteriota bacterium]